MTSWVVQNRNMRRAIFKTVELDGQMSGNISFQNNLNTEI